jgi:hypothetical protein
MRLEEHHEKLRPFVFHGVELNNDATTAKGDCPFCEKSNHFFVKSETGQWSCKRCGYDGNIYTFLQLLINDSIANTTPEDYASIAEDRGVPVWVLQEFHVCLSLITGEVLIPTFNDNKVINNVYRYANLGTDKEPEMKLLGTPGCKIGLFGRHLLTPDQKTVKVNEGPWDGMAMYGALGLTKKKGGRYVQCSKPMPGVLLETTGVLATPGANVFQEHWLEHLAGRNVDLMFDNDHPKVDKTGKVRLVKGQPVRPGWDGMQRINSMVNASRKRPKLLRLTNWGGAGHDSSLPDGYDVRDVFKEQGYAKGFAFFDERLSKVKLEKKPDVTGDEVTQVDPIECTSFKDLVEHYSSKLHMTDSLKDTLCTMMAVIMSTDIGGDQLWFRIIGPPGSGKTTLAEACSVAREYTMPKSILTGFHSGYKEDSKSKTDHSLIPEMKGKAVIVKDADTLVSAPNRDKIMSELRDIYDGTSRSHYRHGKQSDYNDIRTTFLLCGTDELRSLNRSFLGERFLDCEILAVGQDTSPYLHRARQNTYQKVFDSLMPVKVDEQAEGNEVMEGSDAALYLAQHTYGFIQHLKQSIGTKTPPALAEREGLQLEALAQFVSFMRAKVRRDGYDLLYRPRPEVATRLVSQLTKLAVCYAFVMDKPSVDEEVIAKVQKVVRDTCVGLQYDITKVLAGPLAKPELKGQIGGLNIRQVCQVANLPETTVRKFLADMQEFNIVEKYAKENRSGQRGRDLHLWKLTDDMRDLYRNAFLSATPTRNTTIPQAGRAHRLPPKKGKASTPPTPKTKR